MDTNIMNIIVAAVMLILFDVLSGLISAWVTGTFKSGIMREGGKHKLMLVLAIAFGVILDYAQQIATLGFSVPATTIICGYICIMEVLSCIENINKGFPGALPKKLTDILMVAGADQGISIQDPDQKNKEEDVNNGEGN